jgi:hypothetical protein
MFRRESKLPTSGWVKFTPFHLQALPDSRSFCKMAGGTPKATTEPSLHTVLWHDGRETLDSFRRSWDVSIVSLLLAIKPPLYYAHRAVNDILILE